MSVESATGFIIKYYAAGELRVTDTHSGPLHKTETQAVISMIKHLFSGVDRACILDASGQEVNEFLAPVRLSQGQV